MDRTFEFELCYELVGGEKPPEIKLHRFFQTSIHEAVRFAKEALVLYFRRETGATEINLINLAAISEAITMVEHFL